MIRFLFPLWPQRGLISSHERYSIHGTKNEMWTKYRHHHHHYYYVALQMFVFFFLLLTSVNSCSINTTPSQHHVVIADEKMNQKRNERTLSWIHFKFFFSFLCVVLYYYYYFQNIVFLLLLWVCSSHRFSCITEQRIFMLVHSQCLYLNYMASFYRHQHRRRRSYTYTETHKSVFVLKHSVLSLFWFHFG